MLWMCFYELFTLLSYCENVKWFFFFFVVVVAVTEFKMFKGLPFFLPQ